MALSLLSSSSGLRVWFLWERFSDKTEEKEEDKRRRERKRMLEEQVRNKRIISKKKLLLFLLLPRLVIILVSSENKSVSVCLIVMHRSKQRHLLPFLGFLNTNTPPIKTPNVFLILKNEQVSKRRQKTLDFYNLLKLSPVPKLLKLNFFITSPNKESRKHSYVTGKKKKENTLMSSWGIMLIRKRAR